MEKKHCLGDGIFCTISSLSLYDPIWTQENIYKAIEEREDSFRDFLISLNNYGAYDMLVAICEIVYSFYSENIQNWFYEQIRKCPDGEMVLQIKNTFDRRQTRLVNLPQFESFIWENYDSDFLRKISRNSSKNISVWFPMIYEKLKIEKDMDKLVENAFPYLIRCAKDIMELGSEDKIQEALVRMRIADYLCELGLLYYPNITCALKPLLEMDSKLVAEFDDNEYTQKIQEILEKELGHRLYITDAMTDCLQKMIRISEYFGDSLHRKNVLEMKVFMPLFYQLLGRGEEAISLLIDTLQYFSKGDIVREEYLLVFYRSILSTKDEKKRQRLIGIFDEIYFNNSAVNEFLEVAEDINIFYQKYCKDIFDRKKYLLQYPEFFRDNGEYELFTRCFTSNQLSEKFKSLLDIVKNSNSSGFQKSKAIDDFKTLFYSLSSHRDCNIRILPDKVAKVLTGNSSWGSIDEIYDFYTEKERQKICRFATRLENATSQMPAFGLQQYYNGIKQKAESFWDMDEDSILCSKLLTAFRGIQSDFYNKNEYDKDGIVLRKRAEDSINNLVAFFLKAYYGEENVHREEPQGLSGNGHKPGEIDILVYQNGSQFAIQEALKLDSIDKSKLDDHINRMLNNYDTQGVPVTCLVVYAYTQQGNNFFKKMEDYLKDYLNSNLFTYSIVENLKKESIDTANICHHVITYRREERSQRMHVFTVLM